MNWIFRYIIGTKKYSVQCSNPSRLCGRLMSEFPESVFFARVKNAFSFEFSCLSLSEKKINGFLDGYDCEREELNKSGLAYFFISFKNKPGLIIGLILTLITVVYQNSVVWDIEVSGNRRIGFEEIENTLSSVGFAIGKPYKAEELSSICNKFIIKDDRFTRISINMSGNAAFVEVTERTKKNEVEEAPSDSGIISAYDCIIERPEVTSGTSLVQRGQAIEKGTVIISPVELGSDGKEYISGAKGKVYAKTVENFIVFIPLESNETKYNTESHKERIVSFLGIKQKFSNPFKGITEKYICTTTFEKLKLFEKIELPFKVRTIEKIGYMTEAQAITPEKATDTAYQKMYAKLSRDLINCEILSTEFELTESDTYISLHCRVECIRDVAKRIDK